MMDNQSFGTIKLGSESAFAYTFAILFVVIATWPVVFGSGPVRLWALAIAATLVSIRFANQSLLSAPNRVWLNFGIWLGAILSPVIVLVVYSLAVLPTGLVLKLLGRDLLGKRFDPSRSSYWIDRDDQPGTMKNQF